MSTLLQKIEPLAAYNQLVPVGQKVMKSLKKMRDSYQFSQVFLYADLKVPSQLNFIFLSHLISVRIEAEVIEGVYTGFLEVAAYHITDEKQHLVCCLPFNTENINQNKESADSVAERFFDLFIDAAQKYMVENDLPVTLIWN